MGYQGNRKFSLLWYPGGNWSNKWFWDGNVPTSVNGTTSLSDLLNGTTPSMLETDECSSRSEKSFQD